jgi:hypothetical protein
MKKVWGVVLAVLFCFAMAGSAWGQEIATGTIQGTVLDEKGGSVPDASVDIKNPDTNLTRDQNTGSDGRFVFLLVPPGRYTVTISKQGFTTAVQQDLDLTVGQVITLPITMKVGAKEERVVVTATPTIETTETASSDTLNELAVGSTPVLGRKFEDLLTLTPGVAIVQGPDGDEISFNGQRGINNNISLDGGDYNNGFFGEQFGGQRAAIDITLDAVKEFQVVATGASPEFGRTAGGVVNVITKSGSNDLHGDLFYFQRLEALAASTSDGKPLSDFKREQFGGTIGGPIVKDKMFFFASGEGIKDHLRRDNLSTPLAGPACPETAPVAGTNDGDIQANAECQRLALLNFFKTPPSPLTFSQNEGLPVIHEEKNAAALGRFDWNVTPKNQFSASYNFDYSKNPNQTFDVPTYGTSANGVEGPSKIQALNTNFFTTFSATKLNEFHFTYGRENRPRLAVPSGVPDTAMGFGGPTSPTFRFGQPFFLEPNINELFWRTDIHDNFSIIKGKHQFKVGGGYLHSNNTQIFRGFFTGRYIFDSVDGFLHYATPGGAGFGPTAMECSDGTFSTVGGSCPAGATPTGGPLLLFLQHGPTHAGETADASGASSINNNEYALFAQDQWQMFPNFTLNYGLRWEAQLFPDPTIPPASTAYGVNLSNPAFPSNGTIPNQKKMFQPRIGFAWNVRGNGKTVLRASWGIYNARQNMLTEVGAITTNGVQQEEIVGLSCVDPACTASLNTSLPTAIGPPPVYPGVTVPPVLAPGTFPFQPGVTVFDKHYANPRVYTTNAAIEQELGKNWSGYIDITVSKGVHLTRFINPNQGTGFTLPTAGQDTVNYVGNHAVFPNLGDITDTVSSAKSLYRGATIGIRKRFSQHFQMEGNYTLSEDLDDDSNERDPFTFRYANLFDLAKEYSFSDRNERHKFNFWTYADIPGGFNGDIRMQAHTSQPITDNTLGTGTGAPCSINNSQTRFVVVSPGVTVDCGRNHLSKDNGYFSFDWRLTRPFKFHDGRFALIPIIEMFNTFNNKNNVHSSAAPVLFNFDGFLREGVGDPRQAQLAVKFTW